MVFFINWMLWMTQNIIIIIIKYSSQFIKNKMNNIFMKYINFWKQWKWRTNSKQKKQHNAKIKLGFTT
jgi:nicotinamide riboside transporter PnuC